MLLDCLTLWVSNLLASTQAREGVGNWIIAQAEALLAVQRESGAAWVVVSNEVGLGVVPPTPLGRAFEDALGRVNQLFAAQADAVYLMTAGIPLQIKGGECRRPREGGRGFGIVATRLAAARRRVSMSIFTICRSAFITASGAGSMISPKAAGTTCHESP